MSKIMQNSKATILKLVRQTNYLAVSKTLRYNIVLSQPIRGYHLARGGVAECYHGLLRKRIQLDCRPLSLAGSASVTRWSSSNAGQLNQQGSVFSEASNLPPGYIPEPPLPPPPSAVTDSGVEIIQQLNALGEPTLQSVGLGSWFPSGLVQCGLEAIHVGLDIPWWSAIMIGTVCLRLAMFPLVVLGQRNAANLHNHMPIMQNLQSKFSQARVSGNPMEGARAGTELMEYMKKHKVSPYKNMIVPFLQLPIFVSVFVGIRQMANLPVQSMTSGGFGWFTDLTIPDPYFALPLLTMVTFFATIELGVDGVRAASMSTTLRYAMRAMPFIIFPFMINFPSGLLCYWLMSNLFSLFQVLMLKINYVRKVFKIPTLVAHDPSILAQQKKPFIKGIKDSWKNSKTMITVEERQRAEAVKFREAGFGAIQKTYSYDPTKVKPSSSVSAKQK